MQTEEGISTLWDTFETYWFESLPDNYHNPAPIIIGGYSNAVDVM